MTTMRHRAAACLARRFGKLFVLALVALLVTSAVVAVGVTADTSGSDAGMEQTLSAGSSAVSLDARTFASRREERVSRAAPRMQPRIALKPRATDHKFATAPLNIWKAPREEGKRLGLIEWGTRIAVTGQVVGHWAEVLLPRGKQQATRWVNADYLANRKPKPDPLPDESTDSPTESTDAQSGAAPGVGAPCSNGTTVPSGVSSNIAAIHQAVCANWPQITSYGTFREGDDGDHGSGRAVDIMVSGSVAWQVAEFLRANYNEFGLNYVIHAQKIWSVDRSGEGWRYMEDRGSATANHYDHVHASVY
ncbi:SH3 domain-containing protein [Nocardioides caldifontis]|uniref:SH3 domain-containing protein n=1 Tax=Nocardioides caldifontis TaxID=2588938 RepID=UPI0011DF2FA6|nr:SH3 domain-containing protein [Nocardioides caldifontis]